MRGYVFIVIICAAALYHFVPEVRKFVPWRGTTEGKSQGAKTARTVNYACPMHPFSLFDRPGVCPICGMTLVLRDVAVREGVAAQCAVHPPGGVSLSPTQRVLANVTVAKIAIHEFSLDTVAAGKVALDERRLTRISARVQGRIERLHVNFTGSGVATGQPLLDIYSPELVTAQKEFLLAAAGAEQAKESPLAESRSMMEGLKDAARSRLKLWGVTDGQIAELSGTRRPKEILTVFSPVTGVVTERLVTAGQYVNEGAPLFSVAPVSDVWVEAELYENEIDKAALGAAAVITAEAYPGKTFRGKVAFISPLLNPDTRTLKIRINFANPGALLKPEMFVKVTIMGRKVRAPAAPEGAVVITGGRALVWVEKSAGAFEPREVTIGRRGGGYTEVVAGLSAGETVAASGGFLIDAESRLKAARPGSPGVRGEKGT